jgi:hypothetical protein
VRGEGGRRKKEKAEGLGRKKRGESNRREKEGRGVASMFIAFAISRKGREGKERREEKEGRKIRKEKSAWEIRRKGT